MAHKTWNCCGDKLNGLYLSVDHIYNDGYKQKKELNTTASTTIYNWIIANPDKARNKLQVICMNAQIYKKRANIPIDFRTIDQETGMTVKNGLNDNDYNTTG